MNEVQVKYSVYTDQPVAESISFELMTDVLLTIDFDKDNEGITMKMSNTILDNVELQGKLDKEKINVLIRALNQFRKQL